MSSEIQWYIEVFRTYPDPIVIIDSADLVVFANAAFERLASEPGSAIIGGVLSRFFEIPQGVVSSAQLAGMREWSPAVPVRFLRGNGTAREATVSVLAPAAGPDQEPLRACLVREEMAHARFADFMNSIDTGDADASLSAEAWLAGLLDRGTEYFGTDYGAFCLSHGDGRHAVCLNGALADLSDVQGGDEERSSRDLAREVVELANHAQRCRSGRAAKLAECGPDCPVGDGLSAPVHIGGEQTGWLLFANRSGRPARADGFARGVLGAVAQIIGGRIRPDMLGTNAGGLLHDPEHRVQEDLRYQVAFRSAPSKLLILDPQGNIVDATDRFLHHFGYARTELAGLPFHAIVPLAMRQAADAATDPVGGLLRQTSTVPLVIATRQGSGVNVEVAVSRQPHSQLLASVEDVGELDQVRTRIEQRNVELERLNENLQNFASIASHDLQEPLRKIRYFSEMLQRALNEGNQEEVDYALEVLASASRRASRLVSDLLTFSRSSSENLVREPIDLAGLLNDLVEEIRREEEAHDAEILIEVPPMTVTGDPTAVSQLFRNLIGNALKYRSPDRPCRVLISGDVQEEPERRLRITVEDNGIGFEPQYAETILQPFRRLHRRQEIPGSGIGLAICDVVTRRHGWKLVAEGRKGEGATFSVEIPEFGLQR